MIEIIRSYMCSMQLVCGGISPLNCITFHLNTEKELKVILIVYSR